MSKINARKDMLDSDTSLDVDIKGEEESYIEVMKQKQKS